MLGVCNGIRNERNLSGKELVMQQFYNLLGMLSLKLRVSCLSCIGRKMADKQYDVSEATIRSAEAYAKRRAILRQEYIKQITNPHRHGTGEGGTLVRKKCCSHIFHG